MFLTWLKKSGIEDGAPSLLTGTEGAGSGQSSEPCLVAGPYLLGAQLLAVAGVIMVAAAVSYRVQAPWFSRLSWVVVGAGALWLGGKAAYWGAIIAAAASSAEGPTFIPLLFTAGTVSFVIMAGAAVSAVVLRMVRSCRNTVSMV